MTLAVTQMELDRDEIRVDDARDELASTPPRTHAAVETLANTNDTLASSSRAHL
jgi:hypothetical protein